MPVRVAHQHSQPHSASASTSTNPTSASTAYQMQRPSPASSVASLRDDASSTSSISMEGRQRIRLQQSETTHLTRTSSLRSPAKARTVSGARDQPPRKPLLGRTLDLSPRKASTAVGGGSRPDYSLATSASTAFTNNINAKHDGAHASQHSTADPTTTTFYAFPDGTDATQNPSLEDPFEFQPSVNLEDVHRGIIDNEQANSYPSPSRKPSVRNSTAQMNPPRVPPHTSTTTTPGRQAAGSMLRRPSVSRYGSKEQVPRLADRRASSNVTLAVSYRKPVPTANSTATTASSSTAESESARATRRKPTATNPTSLTLPSARREYYTEGGYNRRSPTDGNGGVVIPAASRSAKSKSLQPPPRQLQGQSSNPNLHEQHQRASVAYPPRSPRSPGVKGKGGTPGSSRRISIMPHASGLAARTISPTDARRLKRLSMMNTPPPPPSFSDARSAPGSPALHARKSVTPSSPGITPEPQRKSYHAGLSVTSNPSTSTRGSSTLQPKLALNLGNSRLPRPPPLIDRDDDDIPPVPPIPKNLGSPLEPKSADASSVPSYENTPISTVKSTNSSIFGPRKSSLAPTEHTTEPDNDSVTPTANPSNFTPRKSSLPFNLFPHVPPAHGAEHEPVKHPLPETPQESEPLNMESFDAKLARKPADELFLPEAARPEKETRRKRGMTLGPATFSPPQDRGNQKLANKASTSSLKKKDLTLRLPPLNLLPLSTPTIARVNALWPTSDSDESTPPPPQKLGNRTPGTPMTASKATFFGKHEREDALQRERSRSSFNHGQGTDGSPSSASLRAGSSASSGIPVSTSSRMGRSTISPYVPSSVPRNSSTLEEGARKMKGMHSREKSRTRKSQESLGSSVPEEVPESPSTSHSIRRRLSLSWKKSSQGKNSHAATERAEEYNQGKHKDEHLPPPRLPAASTWAPGAMSTPSPNKPLQTSSTFSAHDRTKSDPWGSPKKEKKVQEKTPAMPTKQSTSSSILPSSMQKMLGGKSSIGQLRSRHQAASLSADPTLDTDDLLAEEEMRKLASKRKNLDQAATQLDELKRRAIPKERMSPQLAIRTGTLNVFERAEVNDFKDHGVYFTGLPDARKHVGDLKSTTLHNYGYDDERGDYAIIKGDHLYYRYEIIDVLGKGSFGQVVRCIDHKTGGLVAVKIIRNKKRFHQQALVEVNILQKLKQWDPHGKHSLINFTDSFHFRGHLCISTELLGMNLYEFIKSNDFKGFSLKMIRRFTKQMLGCLTLLKGHRVIHCDLKPENILLAHPAHTEIKVIDFGSSCFENEKVYTYIQSRFYRSPEVILGMSYGLPIDMWSLGCILAELKTGYPIFPGENEQEQLACIMEVFGPPEKHLIEKSTRRKLFFDSQGKPRMIVSSKGRRRRPSSKTIQSALKCDDDAFIDFVSRCLRWDPDKRMKPDEAMHHEFITGRKASRARSGNYASSTAASDSRERRYTAYSRPLPDPPGHKKSYTNSSTTSTSTTASTVNHTTSHTTSGSPMKQMASNNNGGGSSSSNHAYRRGTNASTTTGTSNKRNSIGATLGSALPRVAGATIGQRSVSGKPSFSSGQTMQERREMRQQQAAQDAAAAAQAAAAAVTGKRSAGANTAASIRVVKDEEK